MAVQNAVPGGHGEREDRTSSKTWLYSERQRLERNGYAHLQHLALVDSHRIFSAVSNFFNYLPLCFPLFFLFFFFFNSYGFNKKQTRWDYIQDGNRVMKDMNRYLAYYKGLTTWGRWVNLNVDPAKTTVFFLGISPPITCKSIPYFFVFWIKILENGLKQNLVSVAETGASPRNPAPAKQSLTSEEGIRRERRWLGWSSIRFWVESRSRWCFLMWPLCLSTGRMVIRQLTAGITPAPIVAIGAFLGCRIRGMSCCMRISLPESFLNRFTDFCLFIFVNAKKEE